MLRCGSNKAICDSSFLEEMLGVCAKSSCAYRCSEAAYAYYSSVANWGGGLINLLKSVHVIRK